MSQIITDSTLLVCSKGAAPMPLKVVSQQISKINGQLVATEMDKIPLVCIPCFGTCMQAVPPPPCVPSPIAWEDQAKLIKVNGLKCLTKDSTIKCALGGTISVVAVPQTLSEEK